MERHRLEREDRFAGLSIGLISSLKRCEEADRAELAAESITTRMALRFCCCQPQMLADIAMLLVDVQHRHVADSNVVIACGEIVLAPLPVDVG